MTRATVGWRPAKSVIPMRSAATRRRRGFRRSPTRLGRILPAASRSRRRSSRRCARHSWQPTKSGAPKRRRRRSTSSPWYAERTDGSRGRDDRRRFRQSGVRRAVGVPRHHGRDGAAGHGAAGRDARQPAGAAFGRRGCRRADPVRQRYAALARCGASGIACCEILARLPHRRAAGRYSGRRAFCAGLEAGRTDRARKFRAGHAGISRPFDDADPAGRQPGLPARTFCWKVRASRGSAHGGPDSAAAPFRRAVEAERGRFPRGVDLILAAPEGIACLPRTTRIKTMEG